MTMKTFSIIIAICMLALSASAQEPELSPREMRKLEKQLKKEQQEKEAEAKMEIVSMMVERAFFVLEADRLRDKYGNTVIVTPTLNFVAADSVSGVIQIGSNYYVGQNGVGGITVEGSIANYEFTRNNRNDTYYVSYTLRTPTGTYDVRMNVFAEGRADATVSSTWPGQLHYSGDLVPPPLSRVYKGMSY